MRKSKWFLLLLCGLVAGPVRGVEAGDLPVRQPVVLPGASYNGDFAANFSGGIRSGAVYLGMVNLFTSFNTGPAGLWPGGEFFVNAACTHGGSPSASLVGDFQGVSNIEAGFQAYMHEMWFRQEIGPVEVIAGLQDLNAGFASCESAGLFLNGSFGIHSTLSHNLPAPVFPLTGLGLHLQIRLTPLLSARIGVFDGLPDGFDRNPYNLKWKIRPEEGVLTIAEADCRIEQATGTAAVYKFGAYYHNHVGMNGEEVGPASVPDYGVYLVADHPVWENPAGRRISLFAQAALSPGKTNGHCHYLGCGVRMTGLLEGRPLDQAGLGIACAGFNEPVNASETAVEFTWLFTVNEYLSLQPDLQYVINPGAVAGRKNALCGLLRFSVSL